MTTSRSCINSRNENFAPSEYVGPSIADVVGDTKNYTLSEFTYENYNGYILAYDNYGLAAEITVENDKNEVYIKNPIYGVDVQHYIKGTVDGNKIVVQLPQPLFEYNGATSYASRCVYDAEASTSYEPAYKIDNSQPLSYTIHEDGSITSDWTDSDVILGLATGEEWNGFGSYGLTYAPFNDSVLTIQDMPADFSDKIQTNWLLFSDGGVTSDGGIISVGVAEYNGKIYLLGACTSNPDALIVGNIDGETVSFPVGQYVGVDSDYGCRLFVYSVSDEYEFDETIDNLTFSYDASEGVLMSTKGTLGVVGGNIEQNDVDVYCEYANCSIKRRPDEISFVPKNPSALDYGRVLDADGCWMLAYTLEALNEDGWPLDEDNLYYRIYDNGALYVFTPDVYVGIDDAITDLPWNKDYYGANKLLDISSQSDNRYVCFYEEPTNPGIQSVYKDGDTEYVSDIIYYDGTVVASIDGVATDKTIASVIYTDLAGRVIANPQTNFYLKTIKYTDGSKQTIKVLVK
jgi:hypothetical protein